ncbi:BQ2448_3116 [Microbotryum intermedium]|uniref:BQ2448_3116 protein n=1 Tax=Microbotryum intermedium TaxID=269621 RepID=A0A238FK34_9BASI|nr:BQ2448_3116 [Microbotryum intermedium]
MVEESSRVDTIELALSDDVAVQLCAMLKRKRAGAPVQFDLVGIEAWSRMFKEEAAAGGLEMENLDGFRKARFMHLCDTMPLSKTPYTPVQYGPLSGGRLEYSDHELPPGATTLARLHAGLDRDAVVEDDDSDANWADDFVDGDEIHVQEAGPSNDKGKKRAIEDPEVPPRKKGGWDNVQPVTSERDDSETGKGKGRDKGKGKGKGKGKERERDTEPEILYLSDDESMGERYTFIPHKAGPAQQHPAAGQGPAPRAQAGPSNPKELHELLWRDSSPPPLRSLSPDNAAARRPPPKPRPNGATDDEQAEQAALDMILAVIPDVDPKHVLSLYHQVLYEKSVDRIVEKLLTDPYPKIVLEPNPPKSDHKRKYYDSDSCDDDADISPAKDTKGYLNVASRPAPDFIYLQAAQTYLLDDFPLMRQADILRVFKNEGKSFYAPTYAKLHAAMKMVDGERGFTLMKKHTTRQKNKEFRYCWSLQNERKWVLRYLDRFAIEKKQEEERAKREEEQLEAEIKSGAYFECGCCFSDTAFSRIATCSEGCQFCRDCATQNVNTQIGMRKCAIPCMSVDGCAAIFLDSELERFLAATTVAALEKIRQEKEVDSAELEGLEKCPFCSFACIIDNPTERLFHCISDACRIVSCRQCKRRDHLPRTCKEEEDAEQKINSVHKVEGTYKGVLAMRLQRIHALAAHSTEAMSEALIRKCPNPRCGEPYIKEDGCNKMTCPSCRTMSCFICGQIVRGYEHFKNAGYVNTPKGSDSASACLLWDDHKTRTFQEVEAARAAAAAEVLNANPNIDQEALKKLQDKAPPVDPRFVRPPPPVEPRPPAAPVPNVAAPAHRGARGKVR